MDTIRDFFADLATAPKETAEGIGFGLLVSIATIVAFAL